MSCERLEWGTSDSEDLMVGGSLCRDMRPPPVDRISRLLSVKSSLLGSFYE